MIVEPFARDELKDNLNRVERVYYSLSTLLCTSCSRSQEVGQCLGAQAGAQQLRKVQTPGASVVSGVRRKRQLNGSPRQESSHCEYLPDTRGLGAQTAQSVAKRGVAAHRFN